MILGGQLFKLKQVHQIEQPMHRINSWVVPNITAAAFKLQGEYSQKLVNNPNSTVTTAPQLDTPCPSVQQHALTAPSHHHQQGLQQHKGPSTLQGNWTGPQHIMCTKGTPATGGPLWYGAPSRALMTTDLRWWHSYDGTLSMAIWWRYSHDWTSTFP